MESQLSSPLPDWSEQLDSLKQIGEQLVKLCERDDTEARQQEMYRYILGAIADGFLNYVNIDMSRPTWTPLWNYSLNYGGPNPDFAYKHTLVDPCGTYRISGYRGTALFVEVTQQVAEFCAPNQSGLSPGTYDLDMLTIGEDGRFSVILSADRPAGYDGDYWQLAPNTHSLLLRQTACDWATELDPRIAIVRLDDVEATTAADMAARFSRLKDFVLGVIQMDVGLTNYYRKHHGVNTIKISKLMQSDINPYPGQIYLDGAFEIADDEALILTTRLPAKFRYWQILLADNRFATVDWLKHQSSINFKQARLDSDGLFRAVVAARDPGVPNWLDTAGERWGIMQMRWNQASEAPEPEVIKVKLSEVRAHLPADTPAISVAERREQLLRRNEAAQFRRLW